MLNHIQRFWSSDFMFIKLVESWIPEEEQVDVLVTFSEARSKLCGQESGKHTFVFLRKAAVVYILYCAETGKLELSGSAVIFLLHRDFREDIKSGEGNYGELEKLPREKLGVEMALTIAALFNFETFSREHIKEIETWLLPLARRGEVMAELLEQALAAVKSRF